MGSTCGRRWLITLAIIAGLALVLPTGSVSSAPGLISSGSSYEGHFDWSCALDDPIVIASNDDFEKYGFEGNGSEAAPYLIMDLEIESPKEGTCISITSTDAFFVIAGCILRSSAADVENSGTGVRLEKVVNGRVEACSMDSLRLGVSLLKSERCRIHYNNITRTQQGIRTEQSIWIDTIDNAVRFCEYGVHLIKSDESRFDGNYIEYCRYGLLVENSVGISQAHNTIQDTAFGMYLYSTTDCQSVGDVVTRSDFGIYAAFSQNCTFLDARSTRCDYGFYLLEIDIGLLDCSLALHNKDYGAYIRSSRYVSMLNCFILDNEGIGLYLLEVTGAKLSGNEIGYNSDADAVDVVGDSTKGLLNDWNGNAWGRYDGSGVKLVPGTRGSRDETPFYIVHVSPLPDLELEAPASTSLEWSAAALNPSFYTITFDGVVEDEGRWEGGNLSVLLSSLDPGEYFVSLEVSSSSGKTAADWVLVHVMDTTIPTWTAAPDDQVLEIGLPLSYQLYADDHYGIVGWTVNNTDFTIIDGLLQNATLLDLGLYPIEIRAYDPSDNYVAADIMISVGDSIPPSVDSPPDVVMSEDETGVFLQWVVGDATPYRYELLRNGTVIDSGEWLPEMRSIQVELTGLSPGLYEYTIILEDRGGNTATDVALVTVQEATTSTTTPVSTTTDSETATTSETSSTTSTSSGPLDGSESILFISIGLAGVAGIVLVVFLSRRRG